MLRHLQRSNAITHDPINIFLCGDVMTGRGIDQVLPRPSDPRLFEPYVRDARRYVELAEEAHGPIAKPVDFSSVWGDALEILEEMAPDLRVINLETAITTCDDAWPGKWINYRMHPGNVRCLTAAGIDLCSLANNHVLDWGHRGLAETVRCLKATGIGSAGAGVDSKEAAAPAIFNIGEGRVLIFAFGHQSSGIPAEWRAYPTTPGVSLLPDLSDRAVRLVAAQIRAARRSGDVAIISLHWGENWGYEIPPEQVRFAHKLIDEAGADIIHGHSSHHVKGIDVHRGKLVIYGCGDFINDYEGIGGHKQYRGDLGLMYFVQVHRESGRLQGLRMKPTRMVRFRVNRASPTETAWLLETLNREGALFSTCVEPAGEDELVLRWE